MTVEELIRRLRDYDPKMQVYFMVEGEQGRSDVYYPISSLSVGYLFGLILST
jgi:hypothetical protein